MATANETNVIEVWILIDESGDYVAHADPDKLGELYDGTWAGARGWRSGKLS